MIVVRFRSVVSLALTLALVMVCSLRALAAPGGGPGGATSGAATVSLAPAGVLTGTGSITINGNAAQSGATVLSGSTIATGSNGSATVDLGPLGHLSLRPNTAVTLTLLPGLVRVGVERGGAVAQTLPAGVAGQVTVDGKPARFSVERGHLDVRTASGEKALNAGEGNRFDNVMGAVVSGDTSYTLALNDSDESGSGGAPSATVTAGAWGIALLSGLAGALVLGVWAGSNNGVRPVPDLPRPSEVVP